MMYILFDNGHSDDGMDETSFREGDWSLKYSDDFMMLYGYHMIPLWFSDQLQETVAMKKTTTTTGTSS